MRYIDLQKYKSYGFHTVCNQPTRPFLTLEMEIHIKIHITKMITIHVALTVVKGK